VAQVSQGLAWASQGPEKVTKWPFCPPFRVFSAFFSKTPKKLMNHATTGVKQLNLSGKNPNVCKWSSPDEIRVWHSLCGILYDKQLYCIYSFEGKLKDNCTVKGPQIDMASDMALKYTRQAWNRCTNTTPLTAKLLGQ